MLTISATKPMIYQRVYPIRMYKTAKVMKYIKNCFLINADF